MQEETNTPTIYPELSEEGKKEAQQLYEAFKAKFHKAAKNILEDVLGELYTEIVHDIETDSWTNYRNHLMRGLTDSYPDMKTKARYDFVKVRKKILEENREEIIKDLNQDMIGEIDQLKQQIKSIYESFNR